MSALYYYDRNGEIINGMRWSELIADDSYRQVARTEIGNVLVSTVWLGLDHGYRNDRPVIFETMVFVGNDHSGAECRRYSTEAEALAGHDLVVGSQWVRGGCLDD